MFLQQTKSLCHFYKSTSGLALGGGCTKTFLDSVHGDVSKVCTADGGPIFQGLCSGMNAVDADGNPVLRVSGVTATILPGLVAVVNNTHHEVVAAGEDPVELSSEAWLNEMMVYSVSTTGTSSIVTINNPDLYFQGQAVITRYYGGSYLGSFTVVNVDAVNYQITVDDGNAIYTAYNQGDIALAPGELSNVHVAVGGAYNDLQTALDNIDAYYRDQWLFFNEDLAPTGSYFIYNGHDGENTNGTKLYIVGYNTYAYDCLPMGYRYFPEGTQNTQVHYKPALERAKNPTDAAIKADLPTATALNIGEWGRVFQLEANVENIQFMGIYFEVPVNRRAVMVNNPTSGSVFVKHCAFGNNLYDTNPVNTTATMLYIYTAATGGGVYDCYGKGVSVTEGSDSTDYSGKWEFARNVINWGGNINPRYAGVLVHHNIFVNCVWGATSVTRGFLDVFNNVFYKCRRAAFHLNSTDGRYSAYNNIVVMDEASELHYGVIRVVSGGTMDYFDYNCYCNQNGQPVTLLVSDAGVNANFNLDTVNKGRHDIEADPLFADPDNFDFNLKSTSPCIGAGRPDIVGNPTSIGLSVPQTTVPIGIFGKKIGLYGA